MKARLAAGDLRGAFLTSDAYYLRTGSALANALLSTSVETEQLVKTCASRTPFKGKPSERISHNCDKVAGPRPTRPHAAQLDGLPPKARPRSTRDSEHPALPVHRNSRSPVAASSRRCAQNYLQSWASDESWSGEASLDRPGNGRGSIFGRGHEAGADGHLWGKAHALEWGVMACNTKGNTDFSRTVGLQANVDVSRAGLDAVYDVEGRAGDLAIGNARQAERRPTNDGWLRVESEQAAAIGEERWRDRNSKPFLARACRQFNCIREHWSVGEPYHAGGFEDRNSHIRLSPREWRDGANAETRTQHHGGETDLASARAT